MSNEKLETDLNPDLVVSEIINQDGTYLKHEERVIEIFIRLTDMVYY